MGSVGGPVVAPRVRREVTSKLDVGLKRGVGSG
jgi:hypothetical protein